MTTNPVARSCPVCGSRDAQSYLSKDELRLVSCRSCSMVYADAVPPELASGQYYDQIAREYYLAPAKLESDYAPVRFERELRLFRKYCESGAVLDVGCSSGAFLFQLKERFGARYQILGTDVSGPPLDYAESRGVPVARGSFLEGAVGERQFNALTFWAVLEHVLEPKAFLVEARRRLLPGGFCFVLVPNMRSLAARLLGRRYRYIYPQHLNYFTTETLLKLVQPDFRVLEVRSTHFNPFVIWQDWRGGGESVANEQRAELLKRTTGYKQNPWLWPVRMIYGGMEKALGALRLADNLAVVLKTKA